MPYYRRHLTYDEVAPYLQKFRLWLRANCPVVKEWEEFGGEAFFLDERTAIVPPKEFNQQLAVMQGANFAQFIPWETDASVGIIYINEKADGQMQTISPSHVRLPKLSHLICLTPEDFFGLLRILDTAKNTQQGNSLALNPAAAGYSSIDSSSLYPYFTKMRVNYRMNTDYCDRKWTRREDIHFLAPLQPTRDNQLSAMQYITAQQNNDLLYFPVESVVNLELDWPQATDEYCIPSP